MIIPATPDRLAEVQAALREELLDAQPEPINVENTVQLFGEQRLDFRGTTYVVPPIPFALGLRLLALQVRFQALGGKTATTEVVRELTAAFDEVADLLPQLVRRRGWLRWLPVRRPRMTEGEALHALGFFLGCRISEIARFRSADPATARHPRPTSTI